MTHSRLLIILGLILFGIFSRLFPHPPNCTAINAIALLSTSTTGSLSVTFLIVFTSMFFSDLVFGLHHSLFYVYFSLGLTVLMGYWLKKQHTNVGFKISACLIGSSLLFFTISNFGVWITGDLYPKTGEGLVACYIAALPFLRNQILGDFLYSSILFGSFACVRYFQKLRAQKAF